MGAQEMRQRLEKQLQAIEHLLRRLPQLQGRRRQHRARLAGQMMRQALQLPQQAGKTRPRLQQLLESVAQTVPIHRKVQRIGRRPLQVMRLVHDQILVVGQHPVFSSDIGQQQGMIDDKQMHGLRSFPRPVEEAALSSVERAIPGIAVLRRRRELRPDGPFPRRRQKELVGIAIERVGQPEQDLRQHHHLIVGSGSPPSQRLELPPAQIMAASL